MDEIFFGDKAIIIFSSEKPIYLKLQSMMLAIATVSACSTVAPPARVGPTAGAPSAHVAQAYETSVSTAATTSTLGGSMIIATLGATGSDITSVTTVATTGSVTHNTGRLVLDDGTYLFIDANGADIDGYITDGDAGGGIGPIFSTDLTGYDYVLPYGLSYTQAGMTYFTAGVAGMVTAAADMPIAGSASYVGKALSSLTHDDPVNFVNDIFLDDGVSTVDVNFAAGSATVNLGDFTRITDDMGTPISAAAASYDQVRGTGLVISGSHIVGGTWVTMSGGSIVNLVGAGQTNSGNGTFFGYDPSISAPDEVGGVVAIRSATATVIGIYIAD